MNTTKLFLMLALSGNAVTVGSAHGMEEEGKIVTSQNQGESLRNVYFGIIRDDNEDARLEKVYNKYNSLFNDKQACSKDKYEFIYYLNKEGEDSKGHSSRLFYEFLHGLYLKDKEETAKKIFALTNLFDLFDVFKIIEKLADMDLKSYSNTWQINGEFCKSLMKMVRGKDAVDEKLEREQQNIGIVDESNEEMSVDDMKEHVPEVFLFIHDVLLSKPERGFRKRLSMENSPYREECVKAVALWCCEKNGEIENFIGQPIPNSIRSNIQNTKFSLREIVDYIDLQEKKSCNSKRANDFLSNAKNNINTRFGVDIEKDIEKQHRLENVMLGSFVTAAGTGFSTLALGLGSAASLFGPFWGATLGLGATTLGLFALGVGLGVYSLFRGVEPAKDKYQERSWTSSEY